MKRKANDLPLPLFLVKQFDTLYPNAYQKCDDVLQDKGTALPDWDSHCIIPIAATLAIQSIYKFDFKTFYPTFPALLQSLYSWRLYKEMYSFDEELSKLLIEQADDIVIPTEILFSLPFPCIYIACNLNQFSGMFCCFEQDMNTKEMEFRITLVNKNETLPLWIHLHNGDTIKQSIQRGVDFTMRNVSNGNVANGISEVGLSTIDITNADNYEFDNMYDLISKALQFVLYICCANSDTQENPEQKSITRKPKPQTPPTDTFKEIRKWDIGYRVGNSIRQSIQQELSSTVSTRSGSSSPKSPHARRGHWHHYWTGNIDNKKIILKWVAPLLFTEMTIIQQ